MKASLKHGAALVLVLASVWLVWSGHFEPLLLTLGAISCAAVVAFARRMGPIDAEVAPTGLPWRAPRYLPWLFLEIAKSNLDVCRRILTPSLPVAPRMIRLRCTQRTDLGRAIYANSITLTPGTVTVAVEGDELTVHALTAEAADGLRGGEMDRRVTAFEGAS